MAKPLRTFLTRITWNDALWRHPSQASGKAETNSYAAENGFGHEEWLNRSEWVINGWRYGFLQGVSISPLKHSGEQVRILLYAVTPAKERRYVGELRRVELVDEKTMNAAARECDDEGLHVRWPKRCELPEATSPCFERASRLTAL